MTERRVVDILCKYRQQLGGRFVCACIQPKMDTDELVKAWLKYLPKEDRIIVHMRFIGGYEWRKISKALEARWGEAGKRTEYKLKKRLSKAVRSIALFMDEYFPTWK